MKIDYLNIYNNLIKLTRNKSLYEKLNKNETFSDRLIFFLLHLAFLFKRLKNVGYDHELQKIYDFSFKQIELSLREIGYGDMTINKKMKDYINVFHSLLYFVDKWENLENEQIKKLFFEYLDISIEYDFFTDYFNDFYRSLKNNTLFYLSKDILTD